MSSLQQKTSLDYYEILDVPRNATPQMICQQYRDIALQTHPALHHANPNEAYRTFSLAAQAFDVLFDPEKKKIYDQYGEQKLKQGLLQEGNLVGKYKFTTDPEEIFQKFFGTRNVFQHLLDVGKGKGDSHPIFKAQYGVTDDRYRVANLVVPVKCTLTELYNGCTKELTYDKKVLSADGKSSETVQQTKTITINPGASKHKPIAFPKQGHQQPGYPQSMLIFNLVEVNQNNFRRQGNNLVYTAHVTLMQALDSKSITLKDLGGQVVSLHFDEIISPQTRRVIGKRGMPLQGRPGEFGDLIVRFDIGFPEELPVEKKRRIVELLRPTY